MRPLRWLLMVGAAVVLLAGCGGGDETETSARERPAPEEKQPQTAATKQPERPRKPLRPLSLTLDGYPNPGNVGILMAAEKGYFEDAGLEVTISSPIIPTRPIRYLSEGIVDLTISHEPQVALAKENGKPVVAVASLIPEPTTAMIWLEESDIEDVADLKGKTIAFPGLPFQEELLKGVLAQAGLTPADVELKQAGYSTVGALLKGRADAVFGATWNVEGAELESRGLEPVVTRVEDLGIPPYEELVLVARPGWLSKNRDLVRDFVAAMNRGTAAAIENPEAATAAILEGSAVENLSPEADREATEAAVEATLPLLEVSVLTSPTP